MDTQSVLGAKIPRIESADKVSGAIQYVNDLRSNDMLFARTVISAEAHADIRSIETDAAYGVEGVLAVVTGKDFPHLTGPILADRPPLAIDRVRYFGEAVALVVADSALAAKRGADLIQINYGKLPLVQSPSEGLRPDAPIIHPNVAKFRRYEEVHPKPGSNIANHVKIRKGNMAAGWHECEVIVEESYAFTQSDHAAMEPRCAQVEIKPDGRVIIHTCSQSPFLIKKLFPLFFDIKESNVIVHVPPVGGGFGGKGSVQLELLAYLASKAVGGRKVHVENTREQDMILSPVHIGLEARMKYGCTADGSLRAAEITYLWDGGAYSDMGVVITKAGATDCTGPYRIPNVHCDSICVYTNHPYAAPFRGFAHPEITFAIERTIDQLARKAGFDPFDFRLKNAIVPGDTSPTGTRLTRSTIGDVPACLMRLREMLVSRGLSDEPISSQNRAVSRNNIVTTGISCFWKTSSSPTDVNAGAIITFNHDGSMNLGIGSVEIGQGNRTVLTQILAERMKVPIADVHINMEVNTELNPEHWKTVASTSTMMVGKAILHAAEDAVRQLKAVASIVLNIPEEQLEVAGGQVFCKQDSSCAVPVKKVAMGYTYPDGHTIGGQVIGRGSYQVKGMTELDPETGRGEPGPQWTVGAQAVQVEFDPATCQYRLLHAFAVIDGGTIINRLGAEGQIAGGMSMGLGFGSRESFRFTRSGEVLNPMLRNYHMMRFGEQPQYHIDFVETPYEDGPYGARGIGEYGVIGMPSALANALSAAAGTELVRLPLVPEEIWRTRRGGGE